jgi:virginiamycin B lyase
MIRRLRAALGALVALLPGSGAYPAGLEPVVEFRLPLFDRPHDVAPAPDGSVWYTAQIKGALGRLDPATGKVSHVPLGFGSHPHGVISGPDGSAWITDEGLNAILRVLPPDGPITRFPLPKEASSADLNTAAFDGSGKLWFTGQGGIYGSVDPQTGNVRVFPAPKGGGPYGITSSPDGRVYFVSLAGDYVGAIDPATGDVTVREPNGPRQGTRRIWADSKGILWATGWDSGNLIRFDPVSLEWGFHRLPGQHPRPYAVYVDEQDRVWVSDWGSNSIYRFDPGGGFTRYSIPTEGAEVRQMLGRPGELWGAESGTDKLLVIKFTK